MYGKLFLLVLVAAAVQCSVPEDVEDASTVITDNGEVEIHKLRQLILTASKAAWQKLHKEVDAKVRQNMIQNELKVKKEAHEMFEQIMKLKQEAEKQKVDIKICLKEEEELRKTPKELRKKVAACDRDLLAKTRAASKEEFKAVEESFQEVKKFGAELKACGKGAESQKCITKVDAEIAQADRDIPAKIEKTIDAIVPVIQKLVPTVEKCVTDAATAAIAKDQKIAKEIETCINSKIHTKH